MAGVTSIGFGIRSTGHDSLQQVDYGTLVALADALNRGRRICLADGLRKMFEDRIGRSIQVMVPMTWKEFGHNAIARRAMPIMDSLLNEGLIRRQTKLAFFLKDGAPFDIIKYDDYFFNYE